MEKSHGDDGRRRAACPDCMMGGTRSDVCAQQHAYMLLLLCAVLA
jgi:hypothetical protein